MALQKQKIQLSIVDGIDTKTDSKNVVGTKFLELENVVSTKTGALNKRFGYDALSKDVLDSTTLESGNAVTTFKDELLMYSSENLYSYLESLNKWDNKGSNRFVLNTSTPIQSDGNTITQTNHASGNGLVCTVYRKKVGSSGNSGIEVRITDKQTNTVIYTYSQIDNLSSFPNVTFFNNRFYITYVKNSTSYYYRSISTASPTSITSETSYATSAATSYCHDEKVIGNRLFLAAPTSTTTLALMYIDNGNSLSTPISLSTTDFTLSVSLCAQDVNNVRISWVEDAVGINAKLVSELYNYDLNTQLVARLSQNISSTIPFNITSVANTTDSLDTDIFYDVSNTGVLKKTIDPTNTVIDTVTVAPKVQLVSKAATIGDKNYVLVEAWNSTITDVVETAFLVSQDGKISSAITKDVGIDKRVQGLGSNQYPISNVEVDNQSIIISHPELTEINSTDATLSASTTVKLHKFDFSQLNNYFDSTLGNNMHISGAILKMYDGNNSVEHGFLQNPKLTFFSQASSAAPGLGSTTVGTTYFYVTVYAWRDNFGQVHRSIPSAPVSTTIPIVVAPNYYQVTLTLDCLHLTEKTNVEIEVYRTEGNGTIFYKCSTFSSSTLNIKTANALSYVDAVTDTDIIKGEPLYTTGNVLENDYADPSRYITTYKNRVILLASDGYGLQYSKLREENGPVEFNANLKIKLDERGGEGTCLSVMDDHVIIFKQRAIFALTGEGPNNLGEQDDFRTPYLITSDCGCVDPNSIVVTPLGILFKSEKGIYILQRGFAVQYIGAPVEGYNDTVVTSATLIDDTNEVRFTLENDVVLVYDYFHNRWGTFKNISGVDSVNYNNQYIYLKSDGSVMKQNEQSYSDGGQYIKTKIVSSWIQLDNLQGFERFYKLLLLGSYKSKHKLRVSFAYNFNPTFVHSVVIDMATALPVTTYGNDDYGIESPYGGEYPLYQFEIRPKIQKCQSFKFKIEDFKDNVDGAAYSISNFAMEIGVKAGLFKKDNAKTFGVST